MCTDETLAGRVILVVDDSTEMTSLLADVLSDSGARVTQANSGQDAMSLLTLGRFDLILLDPTMPPPDGWTVLRFIRACRPDLLERTVIVTAGRYDARQAATPRDCRVACLYKPFQLTDLVVLACDITAAGDHEHAA